MMIVFTEIYRLVSKGSIEEQIYRRQIYKQQMASMGLEANMERRYFNVRIFSEQSVFFVNFTCPRVCME